MPLATFEAWLRRRSRGFASSGPSSADWVRIFAALARVAPAPQVLVGFDFRGEPRLTPLLAMDTDAGR